MLDRKLRDVCQANKAHMLRQPLLLRRAFFLAREARFVRRAVRIVLFTVRVLYRVHEYSSDTERH